MDACLRCHKPFPCKHYALLAHDRYRVLLPYKKLLPLPDRFWAKVEKTEGCWIYGASVDGTGYGMINVNGRQVKAHRYAYTLLVGDIPTGLQLDHLCRVKRCVNPLHLEAVTQSINLLRGHQYKKTGKMFLRSEQLSA